MKKLFSKLFNKTNEVPPSATEKEDYSYVRSMAQAIELYEEGKLFKVLLFPAEFGGQDIPPNVVFVPRGIPEARELVLGTLIHFAQEGLFNQLEVNPEYKGDSFVPSKIKIRAWHSEKSVGEFLPSIDIW